MCLWDRFYIEKVPEISCGGVVCVPSKTPTCQCYKTGKNRTFPRAMSAMQIPNTMSTGFHPTEYSRDYFHIKDVHTELSNLHQKADKTHEGMQNTTFVVQESSKELISAISEMQVAMNRLVSQLGAKKREGVNLDRMMLEFISRKERKNVMRKCFAHFIFVLLKEIRKCGHKYNCMYRYFYFSVLCVCLQKF